MGKPSNFYAPKHCSQCNASKSELVKQCEITEIGNAKPPHPIELYSCSWCGHIDLFYTGEPMEDNTNADHADHDLGTPE